MAEDPLPRRGALLLLGLTAALLLFRLGDVPLIGPDEPRYARVAIEMSRAGEWVTPTLQGEPWLEKPVLYYWLAGISFRGLGETETAARLPAVLATVVEVVFVAWIGARLYGPGAGLTAGFALATSLLTFAYGRAASMDALVASPVTVAIGLIGLRMLGLIGAPAILIAHVFMGLAMLAKGPVGFVLPGLVVLAYLVATREWRWLKELLHPLAIFVFLLVAAPWYVAIILDQGRHFIDVFILDHNLQRFASTAHRHPGPPYYYLPLLLVGLFPWSGLVLPALGALSPRRFRVDLFVLLWLLAPLAFFSLAGSKLPGYILPCFPPLALLIGRGAVALKEARLPFGLGGRAAALLGLALAAAVTTGPLFVSRRGAADWEGVIPAALLALVTTFLFSRLVGRNPAGALAVMRAGAAGFLVLTAYAAPPILDSIESGRRLFMPAFGREVLAWGAWRTNWMAGYFYNDARVREVFEEREIHEAAGADRTLVLCGPAECRRLESNPRLDVRRLAEGARQNALLSVRLSSAEPAPEAADASPS